MHALSASGLSLMPPKSCWPAGSQAEALDPVAANPNVNGPPLVATSVIGAKTLLSLAKASDLRVSDFSRTRIRTTLYFKLI